MLRRLAILAPLLAALVVPATAQATFPGTNGRILYERAFTTSSAGTFFTSLTNGSGVARVYAEFEGRTIDGIRFSPSGAALLFDEHSSTTTAARTSLVRMSAFGRGRVVLQTAVGNPMLGQATWARSGGVYYMRAVPNDTSVIGPSGAVARMFAATNDETTTLHFALSPDGTKVVYVKQDLTDPEHPVEDLWIANVDGTNDHALTALGDLSGGSSTPSTELRWGAGGYIYFTSITPGSGGNDGLSPWFRIREDGTDLALVDSDRNNAVDLQVSPDGRWLLIQVNGNTYRADRFGHNRVRVPGTSAVFSPDSRRIAYARAVRVGTTAIGFPRIEADVYTMALNGTGQVRVTRTTATNEYPVDWQSIAPR